MLFNSTVTVRFGGTVAGLEKAIELSLPLKLLLGKLEAALKPEENSIVFALSK
ncbi:hypothetical protein OGM63_05300 [Plectonema radiosum NIES-515]|uniref:Uncharacterized protein n=1 Tax=Plectonema radiosum NIES-515 TaxID=2986073 RepID=A0ABT3AWG3_9CYAN|nr:hypothetical protein [Plectonema radiosum]MCV3212949.1 hypothetical protein [Plectonema radiosum NIES-515]